MEEWWRTVAPEVEHKLMEIMTLSMSTVPARGDVNSMAGWRWWTAPANIPNGVQTIDDAVLHAQAAGEDPQSEEWDFCINSLEQGGTGGGLVGQNEHEDVLILLEESLGALKKYMQSESQ